jgi:predicted nucleic acid-binding protein
VHDDPRRHLGWIDYLRGDPSAAIAEFDRRLEEREVLMCGPVAAELLTGVGVNERVRLRETLAAMAWVTSIARTG